MDHMFDEIAMQRHHLAAKGYTEKDVSILQDVGILPSRGRALMDHRSRLIPISAGVFMMTQRALEDALGEALGEIKHLHHALDATEFFEFGRHMVLHGIAVERLPMARLFDEISDEVWGAIPLTSDWTPELDRAARVETLGDILAWARFESGNTLHGLLFLMRHLATQTRESRQERDSLFRSLWDQVIAQRTQAAI